MPISPISAHVPAPAHRRALDGALVAVLPGGLVMTGGVYGRAVTTEGTAGTEVLADDTVSMAVA